MSGQRCVTVSPRPLFRLGQVCATPAALKTLEAAGVDPLTLLARHVQLDAGDLCKEDEQQNRSAVEHALFGIDERHSLLFAAIARIEVVAMHQRHRTGPDEF